MNEHYFNSVIRGRNKLQERLCFENFLVKIETVVRIIMGLTRFNSCAYGLWRSVVT